ncbi:MAG TPA: copper resistance protein CopC [Candidatus Limnocylindrales bacterium]|nr:copper resistance protein CopC [Candidatus Limnocylindrales bacterium]
MRRAVAASTIALVWLAVLAGATLAHALPQSSDPSPGSSLAQAPTQVSIVFGERPDAKLSSIRVLDSSGAAVTSGPTTVAPGNADELVVPLNPLPPGVYTVAWRTVSAVDGHNATGSFAFGVGGQTPPPSEVGPGPGTTVSSGPSDAAIAARWLLFVGLIGLLGLSFFGAVVAGAAPFDPRRLVPIAWLLAAVGTVAVIVVQLSEAGVAPADALGTSFGPVIIERTAAMVVAAAAIAAFIIRPRAVRPALAVSGLAAAGALLADVGASHAAAGALPILSVAIQWLHVAAVGMWLGGLAGLLVATRREPGPGTATLVKRFSWVGTAGISIVAATGLVRAIQEVGTIDQLLATDFGHLVIIKTGLLGILALLGAFNHFVSVPAAGRRLRGLRLVGSGELLVGATVILFSASLVNLAPPVEAGGGGGTGPSASPAATIGPLVVSGNDFGTSIRLSLAVSPGLAGFNTFTATATDFDTGQPVAATKVSLRFDLPSRPDIGSSSLDLAPSGSSPGVFVGTGPNLSIAGAWAVTALVVNGTGSVEVPLSVTTRCPTSPSPSPTPIVTQNAAPGLPTIFTESLPAGRSAQVYLDPGTAGHNELHVTFFDANGTELPVQSVTMSIGPSSCAQSPLTPRMLEPGHFVADVDLQSGTDVTEMTGPAPTGEQLAVQIQLTVDPAPPPSAGASPPSSVQP